MMTYAFKNDRVRQVTLVLSYMIAIGVFVACLVFGLGEKVSYAQMPCGSNVCAQGYQEQCDHFGGGWCVPIAGQEGDEHCAKILDNGAIQDICTGGCSPINGQPCSVENSCGMSAGGTYDCDSFCVGTPPSEALCNPPSCEDQGLVGTPPLCYALPPLETCDTNPSLAGCPCPSGFVGTQPTCVVEPPPETCDTNPSLAGCPCPSGFEGVQPSCTLPLTCGDLGLLGTYPICYAAPPPETCDTNPTMDGCSCERSNACNTTYGNFSGGSCNAADPAECVPAPTAELSVQINGGAWVTANQTVNANDSLVFRWNSTNADTCSSAQFNTGGVTSSPGVSVSTPNGGTSVNYAVTCSGPGGSGGDTLTITVTSLPNFSQPTLSFAPSATFDPATGIYSYVDVTFTITNNGSAPVLVSPSVIPDYRLQFAVGQGGLRQGTIGALAVGATFSRTERINNVAFGSKSVTVTADFNNEITESNESDNQRVLNYVLPPPDPGIDFSVDRTQVRKGESVALSWSITAVYPLDCQLFGPGVNEDIDSIVSPFSSGPINAKSEFILRCIEPTTLTTFNESVTVESLGVLEEI